MIRIVNSCYRGILNNNIVLAIVSALLLFQFSASAADSGIAGQVSDPQGKAVPGAQVRLVRRDGSHQELKTDDQGNFTFGGLASGDYRLTADAPGFRSVTTGVTVTLGQLARVGLQLSQFATKTESIVITADPVEPDVDMRNSEVFNRTLFTRDDQVLQQLNAGINAGQHEGGGKSLEIRRFGFNLDHGGVNGGLKVLVDDVQQNQGSQGHGQGYLGSLKALSPELIQDVTIINGPFSAEYGDFSGLGVVHIRQRESLPEQFTVRLQGGNFDTGRGFLAYSPDVEHVDAYIAYEGSYTDGPFINPGRYRRDNVNANYTKIAERQPEARFPLPVRPQRFLLLRPDSARSGERGLLDRFGYIDPTDGGRVKLGTVSAYYSKTFDNGDTFKADGFVGRSLFDLYSNFTFFLNDPVHGDAFQQHDSRLQQGLNAQYTHPHKMGSHRRRSCRPAPTFTTTRSTSASIRAKAASPPAYHPRRRPRHQRRPATRRRV